MRRPSKKLGQLLLAACIAPPFVFAQADSGQGRAVSAGTQSWWVTCTGSGSPTVLLEAGHNEPATTWRFVQPSIASFTRVCSYDRAGVGRSAPPSPGRRTGRTVARELQTLLAALGLAGERYVLVGHSLGGAFVRLFADEHPTSVAGLVLVDAVHEREFDAVDSLLTPAQRAAGAGMRPMSPEGIDIEGVFAELRQHRRPLPHDLAVVARGVPLAANEMPPDWSPGQRRRREALRVALQRELARMSPTGRLIVAARSGHFVHHDEPDVVVAAVRSVVERARAGSAP
jgi:pimeloyl-ACP methyl ester carboxylesterase